ncbi:hypothetical protein PR202_ga16260 [Eleusine coracana subsp. coracana]|uniref:Uncharacterized protein n=1 Tax=Eleusine coracana subsp. coracana TaxID=191504 RepID=A0AAV5CM15_ELECO|nr:hypothetical protein PR202_ga16260 [Eleusine coracana subsp. coracana]
MSSVPFVGGITLLISQERHRRCPVECSFLIVDVVGLLDVVSSLGVGDDKSPPVPVLLPYGGHVLDGHPLGLRQEELDEDRHGGEQRGEDEEERVSEAAEEREERLRDDEVDEHVDRDGDALARGAHLERHDLAGHEPPERAPGPREPRDVDAHDRHGGRRESPRHHPGRAGPSEAGAQEEAHGRHACQHLDAALQEQRAAAEAVDGEDGDEGGGEVDEARDDGGHERRAAAEARRLEQHGRVRLQHDAGELLARGHRHRDRQLGPVPAPQDVAPRVGHGPGRRAGLRQVVELVAHVHARAARALQHRAGLLGPAPLEERVGRVAEEGGARDDDEGRERGEPEAEAPAPARGDPGRAVVHELGEEDADRDHEVEPVVEHAARAGRGHLRQVQRRALGREAHADAEQRAAQDQHRHVHRRGVQGAAREEGEPARQHGPPATRGAGGRGGDEGRRQRGEEDGGGEGGQ